jgi:hypothetical protein
MEYTALPPDVARVENAADLAAFLEVMAQDFDRDRDESRERLERGEQFAGSRWSSLEVGDFLRAWSAWLKDGCLRPGAPFADLIEPLTWRSVAAQIHAARVYE